MPGHLQPWWEPAMVCLHSPEWWRRHWERSSVLDVEIADTMHDGWQAWLDWQRMASPHNHVEIDAVQADRGRFLGYVRVVGRRRTQVTLDKPINSLPVEYTRHPLLRD